MEKQAFNLWENTPGNHEQAPQIHYYKPDNKALDCAVVIFSGGGYGWRAPHEGEGYATFLANNGISAFRYRRHKDSNCRCSIEGHRG